MGTLDVIYAMLGIVVGSSWPMAVGPGVIFASAVSLAFGASVRDDADVVLGALADISEVLAWHAFLPMALGAVAGALWIVYR